MRPHAHFVSGSSSFPFPQVRHVAPVGRKWRVIHVCERARDVLPIVEGQIAVGMRPYIVTPLGAGSAEAYLASAGQDQARALSLLRSWQDVRKWRKSILDCDPENTADVVHAHSFAAGMAAVRSCGCVVYDLVACIDELAISTHQAEAGSWMGRSFRVAEQFVLSRASAVIVHSNSMRDAAVERSSPPENVFVIPEPLPIEEDLTDPSGSPVFLWRRFGFPPEAITVYVPELLPSPDRMISHAFRLVLDAFYIASRELPALRLLINAPLEHRGKVEEMARAVGIHELLCFIEQNDHAAMLRAAHIVVATAELSPDPVLARQPSPSVVRALQNGTALLAADVPRNRDVTPDGRGCLWFSPDHARDLGCRLVFLGRNHDFRLALGAAGRAFIAETRNSTALGNKYAEAYRHAIAHRRSPGTGAAIVSLQPAANMG